MCFSRKTYQQDAVAVEMSTFLNSFLHAVHNTPNVVVKEERLEEVSTDFVVVDLL